MSNISPKTWLCLLVCMAVLTASPAGAAIYSFVDEKGVVHFSNVPTDPRYRRMVPSSPTRFNSKRYERYIRAAAGRYAVDPHLVKAVIKAESDFNPRAVSKMGAKGLMQLMPETIRDMNVSDPFDPKDNIYGGTRYLKKMLNLFNNNLKLALAAYNAGPDRVQQFGRVPRFPETLAYIKKVLRHYKRYRTANSGRVLIASADKP